MGTCTTQNMVLIIGSSIPTSIEVFAYVYLAIGFARALYIIYDIWIRKHHQMMSIMNVVWPITTWYFGPLALWSYWHIGHLNTKNQRESRHIITTHNDNRGGNKSHKSGVILIGKNMICKLGKTN